MGGCPADDDAAAAAALAVQVRDQYSRLEARQDALAERQVALEDSLKAWISEELAKQRQADKWVQEECLAREWRAQNFAEDLQARIIELERKMAKLMEEKSTFVHDSQQPPMQRAQTDSCLDARVMDLEMRLSELADPSRLTKLALHLAKSDAAEAAEAEPQQWQPRRQGSRLYGSRMRLATVETLHPQAGAEGDDLDGGGCEGPLKRREGAGAAEGPERSDLDLRRRLAEVCTRQQFPTSNSEQLKELGGKPGERKAGSYCTSATTSASPSLLRWESNLSGMMEFRS